MPFVLKTQIEKDILVLFGGAYMYYMKGWMRCLKQFEPVVLNLSGQDYIFKKAAIIAEDTSFLNNMIYIGKLSEAVYRILSVSGITMLLINDLNINLDKLKCGDNTVIVLPSNTNRDELYSACNRFLDIQDEIIENRHRLLDAYIADNSLPAILNHTSRIIKNPVMVLDNSFRLIAYSSERKGTDLVWAESIRNGYCSFEYISQFNKLSEIEEIRKGDSPVMAGCLMSPMRRCIASLYSDKKPVGYLLSIEEESPFNTAKVEMIDLASKLVAREVVRTLEMAGLNPYRSSWNAVVNAIEGVPRSEQILREYLRSEGLHTGSVYYVILFSLDSYILKDGENIPLIGLFRKLFPRSAFSHYKNDVLIIVDEPDGDEALEALLRSNEEEFRAKGIRIAVSDGFRDFTGFGRYYKQAKHAQEIMERLEQDKIYCMYDSIRVCDMLLNGTLSEKVPVFLRDKELALYEYDQENGTEYFLTLYSYLRHSRRLEDVSKELNIHKNTVTYRINRVKEMFDLDLANANIRVGLYLAYHVLRLRSLEEEKENE